MLAIQPQTNEHDDRSQRPDELHRRISFEEAHLLPVVSRSKNGQSQPYLGGDKNDARDNKRAMELLIDLRAKVADRGRKPPGFSQEEVNRDNRENHKEGGQGERYCSRALLSALSPHLPPLRIQAGPPRITIINDRCHLHAPLSERNVHWRKKKDTSYTSALDFQAFQRHAASAKADFAFDRSFVPLRKGARAS